MAKSILEYWKVYPGNPNFYVSTCGEVKSKDRWIVGNEKQGGKRFIHGKKKKSVTGNHGYKVVSLNGKVYTVHRLVAETFIPNPDNLPCVNHKDEDKTNNWATNLEWCTHEYNVNYGTAIKRKILSQSKPILQFRKDGSLVRVWPSAMNVQNTLNYNQGHISQCCRGERKTAYNYIWKFKEL